MTDALRRHLDASLYKKGALNGRWRLLRDDEHGVLFEISTPNPAHPWIALLLDLTGYPETAPLGQFWSRKTDQRLEPHLWPQLAGNPAFRSDRAGLYIACDRDALSVHPEWAQASPYTNWRPDIGVVRYLSVVHGLLQSSTVPA